MNAELMQERVRFAGPRGTLSGELTYGVDEPCGAVLLAGPHPYMGGSMANPLLAGIAHALAGIGCVSLRFDYSGVGESDGPRVNVQEAMLEFWRTGHAPQDELLLEDACAAARWLRETAGDLLFVAIGYSFGAYAASVAAVEDCAGLMLISPTLKHHQVRLPARDNLRCKLIEAGQDFATPRERTSEWAARTEGRIEVESFAQADHFFRGLEQQVARSCAEFCFELLKQDGERH